MGLRERNAERTRRHILEVALTLFLEQGYDETRMEQIAEAADIGASTLYRYFPTKDLLVVEPLALRGLMAEAVRGRPVEEPLDVALGHALVAMVAVPRPDVASLRQWLRIAQDSPRAHARMLEDFDRERVLLEQAVADRLGRPHDDLFCQLSARLTMTVLEIVGGHGLAAPAGGDPVALLSDLLGRLAAEPPVLPRLAARPSA